jgi:hypothetical protein
MLPLHRWQGPQSHGPLSGDLLEFDSYVFESASLKTLLAIGYQAAGCGDPPFVGNSLPSERGAKPLRDVSDVSSG